MSQSHAHDHGHDHDHDHDHTPTVTSANERKVLLSFFLIFGFMVVEAVGGVLSGSLALLADAGHMLTDAAALALAYAAFRFGRRAADSKRTFGYLRFEVIAGFLNAVTLFAIVAWIAYEAWERLQAPPVILAGPMMIVAVLGLLVTLFLGFGITRLEFQTGQDSYFNKSDQVYKDSVAYQDLFGGQAMLMLNLRDAVALAQRVEVE